MRSSRLITVVALLFLLVLSCSSNEDAVTPETQDVNAYLAALPGWEQFSPKLESSDEALAQSTSEIYWVGSQIYICRKTPCSITETPEAIATFDPSTEILWLGSLIQGKTYIGGLASMQELPIRQRAPLTIVLRSRAC